MNDESENTTEQELSKTSVSVLALGKLRWFFSDYALWWSGLSSFQKYFPAGSIALYWGTLLLIHGFRSDHLSSGLLILILSYGGRHARVLLGFLLPLLLTGIVYDSQRFYSDYIRGPVHVREPYNFDKYFFGINTPQGRLTPNEWWQLHTFPALDLITGFFYITFIPQYVLFAAFFRFWVSRTGTRARSAAEIARRAPRIMWGFFWLNVIGYTTYYWYAAAPPWYVAIYGLGPANMDARPNPAGCIRFDQALGTHIFSGFYGKSADVFGAVPSLHVAYPLMAIYFAFQLGTGRIYSIIFYLAMVFSAIYLNHHYVLDILAGSLYAITIAIGLDAWMDRKQKRLVS